jgi:hypothetical protein
MGILLSRGFFIGGMYISKANGNTGIIEESEGFKSSLFSILPKYLPSVQLEINYMLPNDMKTLRKLVE